MLDTSYTTEESPLVVHLQLFSCYSVCGFRCTVNEFMDYKQNTNVFWKSDIRLNWRDVGSSKDYSRVFRFYCWDFKWPALAIKMFTVSQDLIL